MIGAVQRIMRAEAGFLMPLSPESIADISHQAATAHGPAARPGNRSLMSRPDSPHAQKEEGSMSDAMYPSTTREAARKRHELSPATEEAFQAYSQKVFAEGALSIRMKQLIAVAVAHVTQCPYCIKGHTKAALRHGASPEELMEAIWVAAEMRAGGAYAHSILAIQEMDAAAEVERA
jgi:AhpD family alkylhydroperoxidase